MARQQLYNFRKLSRSIVALQVKIEVLESAVERTAETLDDMPRASSTAERLSDYAVDLAAHDARLKALKASFECEYICVMT